MRIIIVLEKISDIAAALAAFLLLPLIGSMVFEVFSRYVFSSPTSWAYEVGYMLMAAIFVLGIAYTLKQRQHVSVDIVSGLLGARGKAIVDLVGYCFLFPCVAWITWGLANNAIHSYLTGEVSGESSWNPKLWPYRVVIAIGLAVFAIQIFAECIKAVRGLIVGFDEREARS